MLKRKNTKNLEPILTREERMPETKRPDIAPQYYIVPFGFETEKGECGVPLARISVIINAFTGKFEEIAAFGKPVRYIPKKEANKIISKC